MTHLPKGKVPNYSMRPDPVGSIVCIIIFISGSLISLSFSHRKMVPCLSTKRNNSRNYYRSFNFFFLLVATDKFWLHIYGKKCAHGRHGRH